MTSPHRNRSPANDAAAQGETDALDAAARRPGADLIVVGLGGPARQRAPAVPPRVAHLIDDSSTALFVSP